MKFSISLYVVASVLCLVRSNRTLEEKASDECDICSSIHDIRPSSITLEYIGGLWSNSRYQTSSHVDCEDEVFEYETLVGIHGITFPISIGSKITISDIYESATLSFPDVSCFVDIDTSCSQALVVGDRFGPLVIVPNDDSNCWLDEEDEVEFQEQQASSQTPNSSSANDEFQEQQIPSDSPSSNTVPEDVTAVEDEEDPLRPPADVTGSTKTTKNSKGSSKTNSDPLRPPTQVNDSSSAPKASTKSKGSPKSPPLPDLEADPLGPPSTKSKTASKSSDLEADPLGPPNAKSKTASKSKSLKSSDLEADPIGKGKDSKSLKDSKGKGSKSLKDSKGKGSKSKSSKGKGSKSKSSKGKGSKSKSSKGKGSKSKGSKSKSSKSKSSKSKSSKKKTIPPIPEPTIPPKPTIPPIPEPTDSPTCKCEALGSIGDDGIVTINFDFCGAEPQEGDWIGIYPCDSRTLLADQEWNRSVFYEDVFKVGYTENEIYVNAPAYWYAYTCGSPDDGCQRSDTTVWPTNGTVVLNPAVRGDIYDPRSGYWAFPGGASLPSGCYKAIMNRVSVISAPPYPTVCKEWALGDEFIVP